jgi:citrate lyase subunit alpha / citrate CoA-transferase
LRPDLFEKMKGSSLPIKTIHQLKAEAEKICGKPQKARLTDELVAVIKWVDGTVIDSVFRVDK